MKTKKRTKWIVTKNGVPCGFILRRKFTSRARGVLAPVPEKPHRFCSIKSANHAIDLTLKTVEKVRGSMIDGWDKISAMMEPGRFEVTTEKKVGIPGS